MATAQDLIRVASADIGYSRWTDEQQGTVFGRWYAKKTGAAWYGTNGVPYCAMAVSYWLDKAGVQCPGFPRAVAIDRRDGLKRQVEPLDLQPGDVVGFDWDADYSGDHVGIFKEWVQPRYSFKTIEGNTGNGEVKECTRYVTQVTIGVRPYFDESKSPADQSGLLEVDGVAGPKTIVAWQKLMHTTEDAIIGDQPDYLDAYRSNVWAIQHGSGEWGSELVKAVQRKCGLKGKDVDGVWGKSTSKAIQQYLKKLGYYTGEVDGYFGHHSVNALQRSLNDRRW